MKKPIDFNSIVILGIIGLCALLYFKVTGSISAVLAPDTTNKLIVKGAITQTTDQLKILADRIENEISDLTGSDENLIIGWIQALTIADLSQLYNVFGRRTYGLNLFQKIDLVEYLNKCLNDEEFAIIAPNLKNAGII